MMITLRRAPHGARGLKCFVYGACCFDFGPRPARGAWIEIPMTQRATRAWAGRAPHGARGLKLWVLLTQLVLMRRAPHVARGLKYDINIKKGG